MSEDSKPHSELVERVRGGLRVPNKGTGDAWKALDELVEQLEALRGAAEDVLLAWQGGRRPMTGAMAHLSAVLRGSNPAKSRCPELHPSSTRESQCERPAGHTGDHVATSYSGSAKVYPSKWETEP